MDKKELLSRRNILKAKMDLRRLFIKTHLDLINQSKKHIEENKKEYKQFEREYLDLLELYE